MINVVNGSQRFSIRLIDKNGRSKILSFSSFKKTLLEYDQAISILHNFNDGTREKILKYANYKFVIDLSEYMILGDGLLINEIKNTEFEGGKIFITPHSNYPWREYEVLIIDDERQLGQHPNGVLNKDYIISFMTKYPILRYDWVNPNIMPLVVSETFFEFEN